MAGSVAGHDGHPGDSATRADEPVNVGRCHGGNDRLEGGVGEDVIDGGTGTNTIVP